MAAVLFDLDGTLLDTLGDIAMALNRTLAGYGWEAMAEEEVCRLIGRGSPILMQRAAAARGHELTPAAEATMVQEFFHHYGELHESGEFRAQPYPGASECLQALHAAGVHTAIVTNKQERFARRLIEALAWTGWVDLIVGGDTCQRRKPDPQPLLFACESLATSASQALMVGDSINDVRAARAADIPILCVPYGYNEGTDPRTLPCDAFIDRLSDLPRLLELPGRLS